MEKAKETITDFSYGTERFFLTSNHKFILFNIYQYKIQLDNLKSATENVVKETIMKFK